MLAASGTILVGCEKDHNNFAANPTVNNAFRAMYTNATRASWGERQGYYVVEFWQNGVEAEAWFDAQGVWYLTETDVKFSGLPEAVRTAFATSEWAAWRVDDIDKLEYPDRETAYVIEIEQLDVDLDLWFSPDGVLVKAVLENGTETGTITDPGTTPGTNPGATPGTTPGTGNNTNPGSSTGGSSYGPSMVLPTVKDFIAQKSPAARIIDVENERNTIEVDIVDGRTPREVVFTKAGEWSYTETEIRRTDVPATVLAALSASQYGSWRLDDASHFATPTGEYYLMEVESGSRETNIRIDVNGNIL